MSACGTPERITGWLRCSFCSGSYCYTSVEIDGKAGMGVMHTYPGCDMYMALLEDEYLAALRGKREAEAFVREAIERRLRR